MLHEASPFDRATVYDVAECAIQDLRLANPGAWPTSTEAASDLVVHLVAVMAELVGEDRHHEADLAIAFAERLHLDVRMLYGRELA